MPANPSVSVVIIFLNGAKYLRAAIESVLAQTCLDWELLLVDDGSTDASTALAQEYAARRPDTIRYLEHDGHANRGISASRNLGLRHARGEFLAPLDCDDVWLPGKLERQIRLLRDHPQVTLLYHPALYWREDGFRRIQPMTQPAGFFPRGAMIPWMLDNDHNVPCPSTVLMRREPIAALGGFEASAPALFEDQLMWFKTNAHHAVYRAPECVMEYRIHKDSCCARASERERCLGRVKVYSWLVDYLAKSALPGSQADCLARMARHAYALALQQAERLLEREEAVTDFAAELATLAAAGPAPDWKGPHGARLCFTPEAEKFFHKVQFTRARQDYDRITGGRGRGPARLR